MSHGYTWVGVSAQNSGVNQLRTWNANRYGAAGGNLNVNPTGAGTDDLSYDIFASVAKALKGGYSGADPMGGLDTDTIVATGESQSGSRLATYYNNDPADPRSGRLIPDHRRDGRAALRPAPEQGDQGAERERGHDAGDE